jgi:hypothetical protein
MKPDWNDAPEWAKFLAQDKDRDWWWHEVEPKIDWAFEEWFCEARHKFAGDPVVVNWEKTLEPRP